MEIMTWYPDLSPCDYFGDELSGSVRAIGWLSRQHPYPRGEVSAEVFERLCQLLQNPWDPAVATAGMHLCEFCRFTGGTGVAQYQGYRISGVSASSLFIPGEGIIYVAPTAIAHYIDAHEYCPADEFCRAVMSCPEMRSMAYLKAILGNGGRGLLAKARI